MPSILITVFSGLLITAQDTQTETENRSAAMILAAETATLAGGAHYCAFEPDEIEDFVALAKSKVAAEARDRVDQAVAQVEFNNVLIKAAANEPEGGCEAFRGYFDIQVLRLQRN